MREELRKKWTEEELSPQETEEVIAYARTLSPSDVISFWLALAKMSPAMNTIAGKNIKTVHSFFGPELAKIFENSPELFNLPEKEAAKNAR